MLPRLGRATAPNGMVTSPFKSDKWFQKYFQVHKCALACTLIQAGMCTHTHTHAQSPTNHKHTLPHSLKRKVRPLIQTHRDPASPQVDQRPWRKTNILTYLFLFYSLRKRPAIWQSPGTDGDCPLPESTSVYRRNLRSRSSKRVPQTGIFSTNCYCYGPEG